MESSTLALVGVAAVVIAMMFLNQSLTRRAREHAPMSEAPAQGLLLKFAQHEGSIVGETVALDGEHLILKQAGVYKAVPVAQAKEHDGEVRIDGTVDWNEAIQLGAAWHAAKTAGHDPAITERLTTSADVRSPALNARRGTEEE